MEYLFGYAVTCFLLVAGAGYGFTRLHRAIDREPRVKVQKQPQQIRSHALISFSIILPFSVLSFIGLNFAAMKIARNQGLEGHTSYIATALFLPTVCFLIGYFYFRKAVRS